MFGVTEFLLFIAFLVVALTKRKQHRNFNKNLLPGPRGFPIIGNLIQLTTNAHLQMAKWAREYGKIYKVQIGGNTAVVLNDVKLVKEFVTDTNFSLRMGIPILDFFTGGNYGIVLTNGRAWEEQRRWCLRKLRDFGFGKSSMEALIMDEVDEVVQVIRNNGEKNAILMDKVLDLAVLNSLWTLMNGQRSSFNDPKIRVVFNAHHDGFQVMLNCGMGLAPWLKYIFPNAQKTIETCADLFLKFCMDAVDRHWETWENDKTSRDFIDEYIKEIKRNTDPESSFYGETGRKNLVAVVSDFIQAGSETTSHTLTWMLCYLTQYPQVQDEMQKELFSVVGDKPVGLADKKNLPYCEAFVKETLRYSSLVAGGGTHACLKDKFVDGYLIPKECWIFINIYFIHHDPKIWGDPSTFRPERFLVQSEDGKSQVIKHEALIPFQVGRRQCIGESLAIDTLFLFITNIVKHFKVTRVEQEIPQAIGGGPMLVPKSYNFCFESR